MSARRTALVGVASAVILACTAGTTDPSPGTYTLVFPSTAAAVATDTVQLFLFVPPQDPAQRPYFCDSLIASRKRGDRLVPATPAEPPVNLCELLLGKKPITFAYGERAILAVAQRGGIDFMMGCNIQTIGDGNAILPISLSPTSTEALPATNCKSVGDFCAQRCQ